MRTPLFADTSGWAAYADVDDPFHRATSMIVRDAAFARRVIVTTSLVLSELLSLLTSRHIFDGPDALAFIDRIRDRPTVQIVHVDPDLDSAGWQLLRGRPDKRWSHVDAVSFVVMQRRKLRDALTGDHHFEQANFVRLLK